MSILNVILSETCIHNKRCTHTNMYYTIYVCTYTLLVDSKDPQAVTHPTLKTHAQQPSIPAYMEAHPETEKRHLQEKKHETQTEKFLLRRHPGSTMYMLPSWKVTRADTPLRVVAHRKGQGRLISA